MLLGLRTDVGARGCLVIDIGGGGVTFMLRGTITVALSGTKRRRFPFKGLEIHEELVD